MAEGHREAELHFPAFLVQWTSRCGLPEVLGELDEWRVEV
jgi:hypothetical protein